MFHVKHRAGGGWLQPAPRAGPVEPRTTSLATGATAPGALAAQPREHVVRRRLAQPPGRHAQRRQRRVRLPRPTAGRRTRPRTRVREPESPARRAREPRPAQAGRPRRPAPRAARSPAASPARPAAGVAARRDRRTPRAGARRRRPTPPTARRGVRAIHPEVRHRPPPTRTSCARGPAGSARWSRPQVAASAATSAAAGAFGPAPTRTTGSAPPDDDDTVVPSSAQSISTIASTPRAASPATALAHAGAAAVGHREHGRIARGGQPRLQRAQACGGPVRRAGRRSRCRPGRCGGTRACAPPGPARRPMPPPPRAPAPAAPG